MSAPKERPILFSTPMVQAIQEDRKLVTRRVVKGQALEFLSVDFVPDFVCHKDNGWSPYGYAGDILWVRETWGFSNAGNELPDDYFYKASDEKFEGMTGWKPSIHMPRKACRHHLRITKVSIERLHDITEEQAKLEGVEQWPDGNYKVYGKTAGKYTHARHSFRSLWHSINGEPSWDANPLVWVIEFERLRS